MKNNLQTPLFRLLLVTTLFSQIHTLCEAQNMLSGQWTPLGTGLNGGVSDIYVDGNDVYVAGNFTNAGGNHYADYIARWDGSAWHSLGEPGVDGPVNVVEKFGNDIYIGGKFNGAGEDHSAINLARWDGVKWYNVGEGYFSNIFALAVFQDELYIGGNFSNAFWMANADNLVRWDGESFSAVGGGINLLGNNGVSALVADEHNLYVGGGFYQVGKVPNTRCIARWDGTNWHALDKGYGGDMGVLTLALDGNDLYAGGDGAAIGSQSCGVARWDGTAWHGLDGGISDCIYGDGAYVIDAIDGGCIVGGNFDLAGDVSGTACLAKWDGSDWFAYGVTWLTGLSNSITAIGHQGNDLYVGGGFSTIADVEGTMQIARWVADPVSNHDIKAKTDPEIQVYPNPSHEILYFSTGEEKFQLYKLLVTDLAGKVMIEKQSNEGQLNISTLAPGVYTLRMQSSDRIGIAKFIKY